MTRQDYFKKVYAQRSGKSGDTYLDRHLQRRAEEATNCLLESSPVDTGGVGFGLTESSAWVGMMSDYLRRPGKQFSWRAA